LLIRKFRLLMAGAVVGAACVAAAVAPPGAAAFSEFYGGGSLCGSNCYIQSANAHTFLLNEGWTEGGTPTLACQLFNSKGTNEVGHGSGYCNIYYFGGEFVWARVYNQSGSTHTTTGYAET
jgi:hypothetical protein